MQFVCISAAYSVLFLISQALFGVTGPRGVFSDIDNIHGENVTFAIKVPFSVLSLYDGRNTLWH